MYSNDPERPQPYLITEYNNSLQGFLVAGVDRIIRFSWSAIRTPPAIVRENNKGAVTAVTMLEDGRMVLILDVEKVLANVTRSDEEVFAGLVSSPELKGKCLLFADDSSVAHPVAKGLGAIGDRIHVPRPAGRLAKTAIPLANCATQKASSMSIRSTGSSAISRCRKSTALPDQEHPSRSAARHHPSSCIHPLTGTCNMEKGRTVGATDYITKFDAHCCRVNIT
ncbi:MAG: chemotaxis protein CheW [Nitrospiraceae bacterium]